MVPNFLIVGSAKCGTTSLYSWLKQHPDVFFPENKEPSFFVHHYAVDDWNVYQSLFEKGVGKRVVGDASTSYLSSPESPEWIRKILGPDIKIVILVRNPIDRAFSLYKWMTMEGYETSCPFEKALEVEDRRFNDEEFRIHSPEFFWDYMYVRSSLYGEQIKRYFRTFDRDRIKIFVFDDLVANPASIYDSVCDFLQISKTFRPKFTRENKGVIPKNVALQHLLKQNEWRISSLPQVASLWHKGVVQCMEWNKWLAGESHLDTATRKKLAKVFDEDVSWLGELLGRDLSHWVMT
jgi:hypothetical protein